MGASSFDGQEMIAFLAPPLMWWPAFSLSIKTPVDSQM